MKKTILWSLAAVAVVCGSLTLPHAATSAQKAAAKKPAPKVVEVQKLSKKIVPIVTIGSSLNVGVAQVQGAEKDVRRCKAVAQLETDYKDKARIKILVPVQSENIVQHIDRVPGVSVSALADYAIKK